MCDSSTCIGAQDPYCGWDVVMKKCTSLEESLSMTQWEQSIATCPVSVLMCPARETHVHAKPGCPKILTQIAWGSCTENLPCKSSLCSLHSFTPLACAEPRMMLPGLCYLLWKEISWEKIVLVWKWDVTSLFYAWFFSPGFMSTIFPFVAPIK